MVPCNAPTRYEMEFAHADGRTLRLGFTARHTKAALYKAMCGGPGIAICDMIGPGDFNINWDSKTGRWAFDGAGAGCFVRFGRTEREIKNVA